MCQPSILLSSRMNVQKSFSFKFRPFVMASRPLAQILRGRSSSSNQATAPAAVPSSIASISERIAALEQELQSSTPPSSPPPPPPGDGNRDRDLIEELDQGGAVLRVVSSLLADSSLRIEPLPPEQLPAAHCGSRLGLARGPPAEAGVSERGRGRAVRFAVAAEGEDGPQRKKPRARGSAPSSSSSYSSSSVDANVSAAVGPRGVDAGLLRTVKELVLDNYRPAERVPFYCRLCRWGTALHSRRAGVITTSCA